MVKPEFDEVARFEALQLLGALKMAEDVCRDKFPMVAPHQAAAKLVEEAGELRQELEVDGLQGWSKGLEEIADCFICLADVVRKSPFDWGTIAAAIEFKAAKVATRQSVRRADGLYQHVGSKKAEGANG